MNRPAWRAIASTTGGWEWPVEATAIPAVKSRYSWPSVVYTHDPCPCDTCRSVTWNHTGARCELVVMGRWEVSPASVGSRRSPAHGTPSSREVVTGQVGHNLAETN